MARSTNPNDYIVRIRCGPSYDTSELKTCHVNAENSPTYINGPNFSGYVLVRMIDFNGVVPDNNSIPISHPSSNYFKGKNRRYAITLQGRFKECINGDDILWGISSSVPVKTPPGTTLACKIGQWLDPGMYYELGIPQPYVLSPLLCSMNTIGVFETHSPEVSGNYDKQTGKSLVEDNNYHKLISVTNPEDKPRDDMGIWSFHSRIIPEDVSLLVNHPTLSTLVKKEEYVGFFGRKASVGNGKIELGSFSKRKKFFTDIENRKKVQFDPEFVYCLEFYDAYFDLPTISLKLPGVSVSGFRYWEGQPLRYVARSRSDPDKIFFTVWFEILDRKTIFESSSSIDNKNLNIREGSNESSNNDDQLVIPKFLKPKDNLDASSSHFSMNEVIEKLKKSRIQGGLEEDDEEVFLDSNE